MIKKTLLSLTLPTLLFACSSDLEDESKVASVNSAADVAGVWNASSNDPEFGKDEFYVVITESGQIINYDFLGDEYDNSQACYEKSYGFFGDNGSSEFLGDGELRVTMNLGLDDSDDEDIFLFGSSEINVYLNAELVEDELSFSLLKLEMLGDIAIPDSDDSMEFSFLTDISVENQLSFSFSTTIRSSGQVYSETSSATYERAANGEWRSIKKDYNHPSFSFDEMAESFDQDDMIEELSEVITITKHTASESDFRPLCAASSEAPNKKSFNKQLLKALKPAVLAAY
ncbi:MAG: hypothetical protein HWE10_05655 [Gammaproteobacteria bacterium]|nr:hypothetical protein [Gammaproteobacteria bacterium]